MLARPLGKLGRFEQEMRRVRPFFVSGSLHACYAIHDILARVMGAPRCPILVLSATVGKDIDNERRYRV
jgi:hypothetical protein